MNPKITSNGIEECIAQGKRSIKWHRKDDPEWVSPKDQPNIRRGLVSRSACMEQPYRSWTWADAVSKSMMMGPLTCW